MNYLRLSLFAGFSLSLMISPAAAADGRPPGTKTVLAVVDGAGVTEDDLGMRTQIRQLQRQEYELKMRALDVYVARKALEKAAAARNVSVEEYYRQEVDSKIPEPTSSEVQGFYLGQRDKLREPLDKAWDQVSQALRQAKIQDGRQALAKKLREAMAVEVLFQPTRLAVEVGKAPRRGNASAPVTVVEFGDYQCPYCRRAQPVLRQLAGKYGEKVNFVFKDFPLASIHPHAHAAAEAAHCAGEQGKYWEYHDLLYQSAALNPEVIAETAGKVQIDRESFQNCITSGRYKGTVDQNVEQGQQLGVAGTPAFFVNGVFVNGVQSTEAFERLIDSELRSHGRREGQ